MTTFEETSVPNNILERLERLEELVRSLQMRDAAAERLDELAADLGDVGEGTVGRLQSGTFATQYRIEEGEEFVVTDGYVYFAPLALEINGALTVDGKVYIL